MSIAKNPWYSIVVFIFPTVSLYHQNIDSVVPSKLIGPLIFFTALATFIFAIATLIFRNRQKSGVFTAITALLLFTSGSVLKSQTVTSTTYAINHTFGTNLELFVIPLTTYLILLALAGLLIHNATYNFEQITPYINIVVIVAILIPIIGITTSFLEVNEADISNKQSVLEQNTTVSLNDHPDIYYIVLDRFSSLQTLNQHYNLSTNQFEQYLIDNGFTAVPDAHANYHKTYTSLSSSLNMIHLTHINQNGYKSHERTPFNYMIRNNSVQRILRNNGYQYIRFYNGATDLPGRKVADTVIDVYRPTIAGLTIHSFFGLVMDKTIIPGLYGKTRTGKGPLNLIDASSHNEYLERLSTIGEKNQTQFVYAHILLPHPPYVFNQHGNRVHSPQTDQDVKKRYANQTAATMESMTHVIDTVLKQSGNNTIILIQGDEGQYPARFTWSNRNRRQEPVDWTKQPTAVIEQKTSILQAYRIPDSLNSSEKIKSPVNTFIEIFNSLSNASISRRTPKTYLNNNWDVFNFTRIPAIENTSLDKRHHK